MPPPASPTTLEDSQAPGTDHQTNARIQDEEDTPTETQPASPRPVYRHRSSGLQYYGFCYERQWLVEYGKADNDSFLHAGDGYREHDFLGLGLAKLCRKAGLRLHLEYAWDADGNPIDVILMGDNTSRNWPPFRAVESIRALTETIGGRPDWWRARTSVSHAGPQRSVSQAERPPSRPSSAAQVRRQRSGKESAGSRALSSSRTLHYYGYNVEMQWLVNYGGADNHPYIHTSEGCDAFDYSAIALAKLSSRAKLRLQLNSARDKAGNPVDVLTIGDNTQRKPPFLTAAESIRALSEIVGSSPDWWQARQ
ncbi:hypothetical protein WOLCODRAFT_149408 [Wolfiporia cocos MD-104 SS10]|uniref:Uncharacterized protein n=1 Tax=Wolfiporia cocos (strain MD-104) TaxID=742152 RepID=A0A2H3JR29_WOLCO|nr:hypothetical protein WOLCODRAFT_149408 [Wolfiporia cocos MD-104 SS10]